MLKHRILTLFLFSLATAYIADWVPKGKVLGATTKESGTTTLNQMKVITQTAFDQREDVVYKPIPYDTIYEEDNELEYGLERIKQAGTNGTKTLTYLITYWIAEEIDRQLINTEIEEPTPETITKGTKIIWRTMDTLDGKIKYWHKMHVWATKYDSTCEGCNETTAVGAHVQKGVCATDPKVIPLWTSFYVPGYGRCTALDVGGAIKGNKIDLAYEDASQASWGAAWTDIYLINNEPY